MEDCGKSSVALCDDPDILYCDVLIFLVGIDEVILMLQECDDEELSYKNMAFFCFFICVVIL